MARKDIRMEELVEVLHQWHKWRNVSQIKRAVGLTRHVSGVKSLQLTN